MADLESQILVLTVVAFCLWVSLLWPLQRMSGRLAGLIAAVLSWVGASVSAEWIVAVLRRSGFWPLV